MLCVGSAEIARREEARVRVAMQRIVCSNPILQLETDFCSRRPGKARVY